MAAKRRTNKGGNRSAAKKRASRRHGRTAFTPGEEPPARTARLWQSADAAREAAEKSNDPFVIDRAIELHESLLSTNGFEAFPPSARAVAVMNLGTLLTRRWSMNGRTKRSVEDAVRDYADLRRAVGCFETCETLAPRLVELWGPPFESAQNYLVAALEQDGIENGNTAAAAEAVSIGRFLSENARTHAIRKFQCELLPGLLLTHYRLNGARSTLNEALELLAAPHVGPSFARLVTSQNALYYQYEIDGDVKHLDESICAAGDALERDNLEERDEAFVLMTLGNALSCRYDLLGQLMDLDRAIQHLQRASQYDRSIANSNLCHCHVTKYLHIGDIANVADALDCGRAAVGFASTRYEEQLANMWLCIAARVHYSRYGDSAVLEESIQAGRRALEICTDSHVDRPCILVHLGAAFAVRYALNGEVADLDVATALLEESGTFGDIGSSLRDTQASVLSGVYVANYKRFHDNKYLDLAIDALEKAAATVSSVSYPLALCLENLANFKVDKALSTESQEDIDDAVRTYRRFAREAANTSLPTALRATRRWARWAIARGEWVEAEEAVSIAMDAARQLHARQVAREEREENVSDANGLAAMAGLVYAERGAYDRAVVSIENARCILFSEVVSRHSSELSAVADAGYSDLVRRYQQAVATIDALESFELSLPATDVTVGPKAHEIAAARDELRRVRQDIRALPGFEHFNELPGVASIRDCARGHGTLVYIVHTEWTGLALAVDSDSGNVTAIKLPQSNSNEIARVVGVYETGRVANNALLWSDALARTIDWCGQHILTPIIDALNPTRLTLIPAGDVGLLPLHAAGAVGADHTVASIADSVDISYAPNVQMLSNRVLNPLTHFAGIADPSPSSFPALKSGVAEIRSGAAFFDSATVLSHAQATRDSVIEAVAGANVVHFACHGVADAARPLDSALHLADDTTLMLRDIVAKDLSGLALVVLSACETAVIGAGLPDEVLGLPAGFMQAGVGGVIASWWAVPDQAAAATMIRFYHEWRGGAVSGVEALSRAARWVRDSTNGQKAAFLAAHGLDYGGEIPAALLEGWQARRAHSDPRYWCGFSYWGN